MPDLLNLTLDDMIAEVRRECMMRRQVYGRLVADHKMNKRLADHRIDVMDALLAYLEQRQASE
jgi:hypothetical protein